MRHETGVTPMTVPTAPTGRNGASQLAGAEGPSGVRSPKLNLVKSPQASAPDEIRAGVDEHLDWFMARHAADFQALADR